MLTDIVDIACEMTVDGPLDAPLEVNKSVTSSLPLEEEEEVYVNGTHSDSKYDSGIVLDPIGGDIYCEVTIPSSGDQPSGQTLFLNAILAEKQKLEQNVIELIRVNNSLREETEQLVNQLISLEEELASYRGQIEQTNEKTNSQLVCNGQESGDNYSQQLSVSTDGCEECKKKIAELESENLKFKKQIKDIEELSNKESEVETDSEQIETDFTDETWRSGEGQQSAHNLSFEIMIEKDKLEEKINELKELSDTLCEENDRLVDELTAYKDAFHSCKTKSDEVIDKTEELEKMIRSGQELNQALQNENKELTDKLKELEAVSKQNDELLNQLSTYKEQLTFYKTQSEETVERLIQKTKELETKENYSQQLSDSRSECEEYKNRVFELQTALDQIRQQLQDFEEPSIEDINSNCISSDWKIARLEGISNQSSESADGLREDETLIAAQEEPKSKYVESNRSPQELRDIKYLIEECKNSLIEEMTNRMSELENKFKTQCDQLKVDHQSSVDALEERLKSGEASINKLTELETVRKDNNKLLNEFYNLFYF